MAKILTARQAVDTYFYDGATVTFGGFANGLMHPEEIMVALEEAARSSGHPRGLRVVYASGQGDSGERGLNHLAVDGMCTTVIGGHWGLAPKLGGLAAENKLAAYNLPQGVISGLFREIAAKRPGVITHVGLDTFVDPRLEGGKMNRAAHEAGDMVKLIELEGEEKLFYPAFPIDIAVIRATYADERGNCTFEREGVYAEALAQAQAAHNSGGRVIVQVEKVVSYGCLDARLIRLPGIYVDALVVARPENHMQTFGTQYDPAFSGEIRTPLNALSPLPMGARKIIARRAAMELTPCAVTNLGIGMPEGVASVAQMDGDGNVNVSKFGPKIAGCGGFINITQNAKKVVYCGTFTAGGLEVSAADGTLKLLREGKVKKLVRQVEQVTFAGRYAIKHNQPVLYITERAVFALTPEGVALKEVAPGVDIQRDILDQMEFTPVITDVTTMDSRIFREERMGLAQQNPGSSGTTQEQEVKQCLFGK